jgi:GNAT superfamily N-acetyltransferase
MITFSKVKDLDKESYKKFRYLTLKRGFSRGHFKDCFEQKHEFSKVAFISDENKNIEAWALMVQCLDEKSNLKEYSINFYTRKPLRGLGLGYALFNSVEKQLKKEGAVGHVCIWSEESDRFYTKNKSDLIRVIIAPKYKKL